MYAIGNGSLIRFLWVHVNDAHDQPKDAIVPSEQIEEVVREFRRIYDDLTKPDSA
jgi:hypothetical protein